MSPSKIEWTEETWNPTTGCSKVSPGCAHCYAETLTARYAGSKGWPAEFLPWTPANATENVVLHPDRLEAPFSWRKPRRVFVNSMSDLFHEQIPDEFIDRVFAVMALSPQHTFQVLTKRIERAQEYLAGLTSGEVDRRLCPAADRFINQGLGGDNHPCDPWPLPNVLIGPTIENQHFADVRLQVLAQIKALGWRTMVSYEPALGPVNFAAGLVREDEDQGIVADPSIDWLICGGESGPNRRPFNLEWARWARDQAEAADVPFFMKQDGALRSGVYDTLPEDLRVREYPR